MFPCWFHWIFYKEKNFARENVFSEKKIGFKQERKVWKLLTSIIDVERRHFLKVESMEGTTQLTS